MLEFAWARFCAIAICIHLHHLGLLVIQTEVISGLIVWLSFTFVSLSFELAFVKNNITIIMLIITSFAVDILVWIYVLAARWVIILPVSHWYCHFLLWWGAHSLWIIIIIDWISVRGCLEIFAVWRHSGYCLRGQVWRRHLLALFALGWSLPSWRSD